MHKRNLMKLGDPHENPVAMKLSSSPAFRVAWEECLLLVRFIEQQKQFDTDSIVSQSSSSKLAQVPSTSKVYSASTETLEQSNLLAVSDASIELKNSVIDIQMKLSTCSFAPSHKHPKTPSKLPNTVVFCACLQQSTIE